VVKALPVENEVVMSSEEEPVQSNLAVTEPEVGTVAVVYWKPVPPTAAFAGITDKRPKPNAETATSAMRLRVVFVDIYFLSEKVGFKTFLNPAGAEISHS